MEERYRRKELELWKEATKRRRKDETEKTTKRLSGGKNMLERIKWKKENRRKIPEERNWSEAT